MWNSITAIATSLTVAVALGVPLMIWWLTKPKVRLLKVSPIGWFFTYKDGKVADGAVLTLTATLQNKGNEPSTLEGRFITSRGGWELVANEILDGHGTITEFYLLFETKLLPTSGETLNGKLILEPWGNRRLLFGKKYLTCKLNIPENQTARVLGIKGVV